MKKTEGLFDILVAVAAFVGFVVMTGWILDAMLGTPDAESKQRREIDEKDNRIARLTTENEQLVLEHCELERENVRLRRLLQWWNLAKELVCRLAGRFLAECARQVIGVALRFA